MSLLRLARTADLESVSFIRGSFRAASWNPACWREAERGVDDRALRVRVVDLHERAGGAEDKLLFLAAAAHDREGDSVDRTLLVDRSNLLSGSRTCCASAIVFSRCKGTLNFFLRFPPPLATSPTLQPPLPPPPTPPAPPRPRPPPAINFFLRRNRGVKSRLLSGLDFRQAMLMSFFGKISDSPVTKRGSLISRSPLTNRHSLLTSVGSGLPIGSRRRSSCCVCCCNWWPRSACTSAIALAALPCQVAILQRPKTSNAQISSRRLFARFALFCTCGREGVRK